MRSHRRNLLGRQRRGILGCGYGSVSVRLLEEERSTCAALQSYVRTQNRMWRLPLIAMEDLFSASTEAGARTAPTTGAA